MSCVPIALDPGIARAAPGPARELTMPVGWCAPAELQYELPEETTVGDLTSDLDGQLAAEEHRQGLGVVDGHCADCDTKVRAAYREKGQRECSHDVTHRIMSMGGEVIVRACDRCGARLSVA